MSEITEKELTLFISMCWKGHKMWEDMTNFGQRLVTENRSLKKKIKELEKQINQPIKKETDTI